MSLPMYPLLIRECTTAVPKQTPNTACTHTHTHTHAHTHTPSQAHTPHTTNQPHTTHPRTHLTVGVLLHAAPWPGGPAPVPVAHRPGTLPWLPWQWALSHVRRWLCVCVCVCV